MHEDSSSQSRPEVRDTRTHYSGRIFQVRTETVVLPSGTTQSLEIVEHGGAVAIAAVDDEGRLACVRQYRHAAGEELIEVPAGRLEDGEDPAVAARRELEEETGLRAERLEELAAFYPAPGFCSEFITVYRATGLSLAGADRLAPDEDEEIEVVWLRPDELIALPCRDAKSIIAASLVLRT